MRGLDGAESTGEVADRARRSGPRADRRRSRTNASADQRAARASSGGGSDEAAAAPAVKGGASIAAPAAKASLDREARRDVDVGVGLAGGVVLENDRPARTEPSASPAATAQQSAARPRLAAPSHPFPFPQIRSPPRHRRTPLLPGLLDAERSGRARMSSRTGGRIERRSSAARRDPLLRKAERAISPAARAAPQWICSPSTAPLSERHARGGAGRRASSPCELGRAEEARTAADAFLRDHPGSTLADPGPLVVRRSRERALSHETARLRA